MLHEHKNHSLFLPSIVDAAYFGSLRAGNAGHHAAGHAHGIVVRVHLAQSNRQIANGHHAGRAVGQCVLHALDLLLFAKEPSQRGLDALLLLHSGSGSISGHPRSRRLQHGHGAHGVVVPQRLLAAVARAERRQAVAVAAQLHVAATVVRRHRSIGIDANGTPPQLLLAVGQCLGHTLQAHGAGSQGRGSPART